MNIKKEKNVCMTYFGDGSASEGDFHEALNFASVFAAPVIFVCQNNQYAISVPLHKQMKAETIAQRSIAYGMPGVRVDGNDILSVYVAAKEAVDRARSGGGPTLIEGLTYRVTPHTTADDPKRYRKEDEVEPWTKRDCIARMTHYMLKRAVMSEAEIKSLEEEVDTTIKAAVKRFEELGATPELQDPLAMFDYLYADTPQFLQEQRDELARYLGKGKGSESKQPQASRRGG
jgi:TPP-dependent pyruvate/acetoin dehydrogenase alpha subunit